MKLNTRRNTIVVDVDGVIVENPPEGMKPPRGIMPAPITDFSFWDRHWNKPDEAKLQTDMTALVQNMISGGCQIIMLTARPESYRKVTERLMYRAGIFVRPNTEGITIHDNIGSNSPVLVMYPNGEHKNSAAWKQAMIAQWLHEGVQISLMIEDFRVNAEAIRPLVPVLLYERKKVSDYTDACACGGIGDNCWCPDAHDVDVSG